MERRTRPSFCRRAISSGERSCRETEDRRWTYLPREREREREREKTRVRNVRGMEMEVSL